MFEALPRIFCSADVLRSLDRMAVETSNRAVRARSLDVVDYTPRDARPETHLALEGTVTLLVARQKSPLMAEIRAALSSTSRRSGDVGSNWRLQKGVR
jgi:hypothetical protein